MTLRDVGSADTARPDAVGIDFAALPPVPRRGSWRAELFLALGHLTSIHQIAALIVAVFAVLAVTVGVATVNIVLAVMTGFEVDLRDKILGANAHIVVLRYNGNVLDPDKAREQVAEVDGVVAAAPFVYTEAMIRSPWGAQGIILKGIDPAHTGDVTAVREDLVYGPEGRLEDDAARDALFQRMSGRFGPVGPVLDDTVREELPGILIGKELMESLQVDPGDKVQVIDPLGGSTGLMGMPVPKVRSFRVAGVYDSGMYEYDTKWTYVHNQDAQAFMDIGESVTGIEVRVDDIDDVDRISADITTALGYPNYTKHWKQLNQDLFEALELEKVVMGLILFLTVGNASLLICTTVIMVVLGKRREIAILKAMGARWTSILRVFLVEGAVIGALGTLAGTGLGLAGCVFLDWYGYPLQTDVYFLSELPVVVEYENVVTIAVAAFFNALLVTAFPAFWAAFQNPVHGLRNE